MNRLKRAAVIAVTAIAAIAGPAIVVASSAPNPDPTLATYATQLRDKAAHLDDVADGIHQDASDLRAEADQIDTYGAPTTTTTTPTTTVPDTSTTVGPEESTTTTTVAPTTTTVAPTTTTAPTSTRDLRTWPFASNSPWNIPLGDQATFDGRSLTNGDVRVSAGNGYGICVGGAGYALNTSCNNGEGHYSIINGKSATEYYGGKASNGSVTSFKNKMTTDLAGSGVNVGYDVATKLSQLGGLVRQADLSRGSIPHVLQVNLAANIISKSVVWPAFDGDGFKATNTGFLPYGALVAIPRGVPMPAGLSAVGQEVWHALQTYGAYVTDATGANPSNQSVMAFRWEPSVAAPAGADLAKIGTQLRWVTNSNQSQPGGAGARLAPLAP